MHKYWIHNKTGLKAKFLGISPLSKQSVTLLVKYKSGARKEVWTKRTLKKQYITITKAEYDSDITLEEIERNRRNYEIIFSIGSIVICTKHENTCNRRHPIIGHQYQVISTTDNCKLFTFEDCVTRDRVTMSLEEASESFIPQDDWNNFGDRLRKTKLEVGSNHYQKSIQPWDYIYANHLGFDEGNIVKYITRHKEKNGAEDIKKIISYAKHILRTQYNEEL